MKLGSKMVKVTLGMGSERQISKSNLILLGLECQPERRYLSRTLLISPGQRQPSCFPGKRIRHAYTTCWNRRVGPEHTPPGPSSLGWHGEDAAGGQPVNEELRHLAEQPQSLAISEGCKLLPPTRSKSTHTFVWGSTHTFVGEQQHWPRGCARSAGQRVWRWGSVGWARHTDHRHTDHRHPMSISSCVWPSAAFSSWLGPTEQLWVTWGENHSLWGINHMILSRQ